MARIKLIVTGDMEKLALHESLKRYFPSSRNGEEVVWDKPHCVSGATSFRLAQGKPPNTAMQKLAQAMLAEALAGKIGTPADLIVVIDDVELGNLGQEAVIAAHFRQAVKHELASRYASASVQTRHGGIVRTKCSFHLLKPMVESYLFGDREALVLAGVPSGIEPVLVHPSDVEQFESGDPVWLPTCVAENIKRQQANPWWQHERHPKHYLEHLTERSQVFYEETRHGKNALLALRWDKVPKCPDDTPIIRALFEDIADWFGIASPLGGATHPAFYPAKSVNRNSLLLRNM